MHWISLRSVSGDSHGSVRAAVVDREPRRRDRDDDDDDADDAADDDDDAADARRGPRKFLTRSFSTLSTMLHSVSPCTVLARFTATSSCFVICNDLRSITTFSAVIASSSVMAPTTSRLGIPGRYTTFRKRIKYKSRTAVSYRFHIPNPSINVSDFLQVSHPELSHQCNQTLFRHHLHSL